ISVNSYDTPRVRQSLPTRRASDLATLLQPAPGGGTGVDDAPDGAGVAPGHGVHQGGEMLGKGSGRLHHRVGVEGEDVAPQGPGTDRKSTRLNSSHVKISYAVFCLQ